ncbi:hypothetical protein PG991_003760 [Apiospora marii]|uniref:Uncharacterized protein n=1 Tax=Apiospora marii TaxID=335849 RepID=A0ABR1S4A1_9PEZI
MLSSIIQTALLLVGVAQADFVMMRYKAGRDSTRPEAYHESFYFANLTDDQVATNTRPPICPVSQLYPRVGGLAEWAAESDHHILGVVVDEGEKDEKFDMSNPKRVEVYWGKDEGHFTLYGETHGGNKPYTVINTSDQKKGDCVMEFRDTPGLPCLDKFDKTWATVWPFAKCDSSFFHPPIERYVVREPVANSASR